MLSTPAIQVSERLHSQFDLCARANQQPNVELDIPTHLRFPNSPEGMRSVMIRRVNGGFLKLFARQRIPVEAHVQVLFRGEPINGAIVYCRPEGDGFSVGVTCSRLGTVRRELRVPVDFPGEVRTAESEAPVRARIIDVSSSGLGLNLPIEIKPGTIVAVEFARGTVFGEIRHCVQMTGYFRAGLAIREFAGVGLLRGHTADRHKPQS